MAEGWPDVVVIGSGPNGLSAAVALARAGARVTVYEAAAHVGGGTRTEELTLPGFRHDVCSTVHPMAAGSPFFSRLPLGEFGLEWIEPPVLVAHPFADGTAAVLMRSLADTAAGLGVDRRAYHRLMTPFARRWKQVMSGALGPPLRVPRRPLLMARLGFYGLPPASTLVRYMFRSERARAFFLGIAGHALLPMTKAPSSAFGIMLAMAGHGAGWPFARGGSQRIADALAGLLGRHGGRIVTDSPVHSLAAFSGAITVLDLSPRQVLAIAGDRFPARYRRHLANYRYACGIFKVDWALSAPIPWTAPECRAAGTVHLGPSDSDIIRSSANAWFGREDDRPYVIVTQPSLFDSSRAPDGRHTAWAYCHVPHGSVEDRTEAIEGQIERFAPGFRGTVLARHTMNTHQVEVHDANMIGGDINGGVQDLRQFVFRPARPLDPYTTPAKDIFLCSASTPPGGAVHGMCGYHAARSILRRIARRR